MHSGGGVMAAFGVLGKSSPITTVVSTASTSPTGGRFGLGIVHEQDCGCDPSLLPEHNVIPPRCPCCKKPWKRTN